MARIFMVGAALIATLAFGSAAKAGPWAEVGDAGGLPSTAQIPF